MEAEKVNSVIEPLSLSEEAWLNTITDNLHLKECKSCDEVEFDEEDTLMMLKEAVKECYERESNFLVLLVCHTKKLNKLWQMNTKPEEWFPWRKSAKDYRGTSLP